MKYLLVSDIHGCLPTLERVLHFFDQGHYDMLCILGDILNYGPRNRIPEGIDPKGIVERLNAMKDRIIAMRGNCDAEVDQMLLEFPIMADYALVVDNGRRLFLTHGHVYNEDHLPPLHRGDILLHGHTHIPKCTVHDTYICMNPGSISIPKENTHHGYMTLDGGVFRWHDLDGNVVDEYGVPDGEI